MAVAAALNVLLTAQTAQFQAGMKKAETTLKGLDKASSSITGTLAKVKGGFAAIAAAVGARYIASEIVGTVKAIDDAGDAAERLGIQFQNLRALQESSLKNAGVSFEVVSNAIEKMNLNLAKSSEARTKLKGIGLAASDLVGGDAGSRFIKIVEALREVESSGKRAAIIQETFGKQAREVGNIVNMTAEQFDKWKRSSVDLTGQLNGEQLDALNKTNAAIEQMGLAWDKFKERAVAALAPTLNMVLELSNAMLDIDPTGRALNDARARGEQSKQARREEAMRPAEFAKKFVPDAQRQKTISSMLTDPARKFAEAAEKALNTALFRASQMRIKERKAQEAKDAASSAAGSGLLGILGLGKHLIEQEQIRRSTIVGPAASISAGSQADALFDFRRRQSAENKQKRPEEKLLTEIARTLKDIKGKAPQVFDLGFF